MTDKQHDFEGALDTHFRLKILIENHYPPEHIETIQTALRIADRLQKGDVSDEMLREAGFAADPMGGEDYREKFFPMRYRLASKQLIKEEVEDE